MSVGPGGGLSISSGSDTYRSNIPPWHLFAVELEKRSMQKLADIIRQNVSYVRAGKF